MEARCKFARTKIRAGDALHVAVAAELGATLCTLDKRFAEAAVVLGVGAELVRSHHGCTVACRQPAGRWAVKAPLTVIGYGQPMQKHVFRFMSRRVELWTHPEPDYMGKVIRITGQFYETDVLMKCRERYWPGAAIIDVGANIGNHAVFFGAILNAPVYAFEPYKPNRDLLEVNIVANGLDGQVVPLGCAIGAADGTGSLHPGPSTNPGTTVVSFGAGQVPVRSLDSLAIPGRIGLLKVDVEGAEPAVLMGATALIQTWRPDIVVEAGTTAAFAAIATILAGLDYVPQGRFADTPTYLFVAIDQRTRMRGFLASA